MRRSRPEIRIFPSTRKHSDLGPGIMSLHRPITLDSGIEVCAHCWDIHLAGNRHGEPEILEWLHWPCPSAREESLAIPAVDDALVEAVARTAHAISEEEYPVADREEFESLSNDDREFLLYEARLWLTAARRYAQEG